MLTNTAEGDWKSEDEITTNQSVWSSVYIYSFFFFASSSQSVRKALFLVNWLAATPGNSLLLSAFLPWEIVMPNHPTLEHSQEREKEGDERESHCLAGQLLWRSEGTQPIRSGFTRLTSLWWKKGTEPEPEWDRREEQRNTKHVLSEKWAPDCSKCSPVERTKSGDCFEIVAQKLLTVYCLCGWPAHAHFQSSFARDRGQVSICQSESQAPVCLCRKIRWNTIWTRTHRTQSMITARKHDCPLVPIKAHCFHTSASERNKDSKPPAIESQLTGIKGGKL